MALKDLKASKAQATEKTLEKIIAPFARYDESVQEVVMLPQASALSPTNQILVYLVARKGWRFVVNDPPPEAAKPSDVQAATGLPGGTVRPSLMTLKKKRIVVAREGRYSVPDHNLLHVTSMLSPGESLGDE